MTTSLTHLQKQMPVLLLFTFICLFAVACGDSGTDAGPEEEPEPGEPLTGAENFPLDEILEGTIPVTISAFKEDPDREDMWLDVEFNTSGECEINLNGVTMFTSCDAGYNFVPLDEPIDYGETFELELIYGGSSYSLNLTMPYKAQLNVPDAFLAGDASNLTWSIQEDPGLFLLGWYNDDGYGRFPLIEGSERSLAVDQPTVSEITGSSWWELELVSLNYGYWNEDGVIFMGGTYDFYSNTSAGKARPSDAAETIRKHFFRRK